MLMRNGRPAMLSTAVLCLIMALQYPLRAQQPPQRSVFLIEVWEQVQGGRNFQWRSVNQGTAFFVSEDGTALTASHVVYRVRQSRYYSLLAVIGREFYSAALVCASELPYDPTTQQTHIGNSRDVAEIRVTHPEFPFDQISHNGVPFATAHRGRMPAFPALSFGPEPSVGDPVRVLGFGAVATQPLPYEWSADGEVNRDETFSDGTPGFKIVFSDNAVAGGQSGSPVLNATGQVVGLLDWRDANNIQVGTAIGRRALDPACP